MSSSRPLSLAARLTLALSIALVAFLGISGVVLDRLFRDYAQQAVNDRLQGVLFTLLAATELNEQGGLRIPEATPEPRLGIPGSGLYARVAGPGLEWTSVSAQRQQLDWPVAVSTGETRFDPPQSLASGVFVLSLGVGWELESGEALPFTFQTAEATDTYLMQIATFRRALWGWLGAAAVLLLAVQALVLRWSLRPLRQVSSELARVRKGEESELRGHYPEELAALTDSVNAFIESERRQLARYRNSLADLAHSLKTPLTVLRTALDQGDQDPAAAQLLTQLDRMDDIVGYQLKRARTQGQTALAVPVAIEPIAESVVQTLEQAFRQKQVQCEFEIAANARFIGEKGDLTELLGNLLENAFKWCRHHVLLTAQGDAEAGLILAVADDGTGIDPDLVRVVLDRGVRGDEQTPGHGIGLAVVREIVDAYGGRLEILRSELGGAEVRLYFGQRS